MRKQNPEYQVSIYFIHLIKKYCNEVPGIVSVAEMERTLPLPPRITHSTGGSENGQSLRQGMCYHVYNGNTEKADFMCESLRKVSWSKEYISRLLKMNWSLPGGWLWGFSTEWKQYVQNGDSKKNDFGRVGLTWLE